MVRGWWPVLCLIPRLFLTWLVFLLVCELLLGGLEPASQHLGERTIEWGREILEESVPASLDGVSSGEPVSWRAVIGRATLASLQVSGFAILICLAFSPVLGILAGRFRRFPWVEVLLSPLLVAGWIPGFLTASFAIWWQVTHWGHPPTASGETAVGGPVAIEWWWRVILVAIPPALVGVGWQIRSASGQLKRRAQAPEVAAALARGVPGSVRFYRHVVGNSIPVLMRSFDRSFAAMMGIQMVVEWTFGFPGLGTLLVNCAREEALAGLVASGVILTSLVFLTRWFGEWLVIVLRGREGMATSG